MSDLNKVQLVERGKVFSVVARTDQPNEADHDITPDMYDYLNVDLDNEL